MQKRNVIYIVYNALFKQHMLPIIICSETNNSLLEANAIWLSWSPMHTSMNTTLIGLTNLLLCQVVLYTMGHPHSTLCRILLYPYSITASAGVLLPNVIHGLSSASPHDQLMRTGRMFRAGDLKTEVVKWPLDVSSWESGSLRAEEKGLLLLLFSDWREL